MNRICTEDLDEFFLTYPKACRRCQGWGTVLDTVLGTLHDMDCPECVGRSWCGICGWPLGTNTDDPNPYWLGYWDGHPCPACGWNQDLGGPGDPPGCVCDFEEIENDLPF
jgi:hypothetical protein